MPDNVGIPLHEEHGGSTFFLLEVHYDNPSLNEGVTDNSGLRMYLTPNVRENDAGILQLGATVGPGLILPPRREEFVIRGWCTPECTEQVSHKKHVQ